MESAFIDVCVLISPEKQSDTIWSTITGSRASDPDASIVLESVRDQHPRLANTDLHVLGDGVELRCEVTLQDRITLQK
eukprot:m.117115 g.117115  ORF g.117115 m.117115 type:complete len:78 (+) comp13176_c0_seq1:2117-2350(+)